MVERGRAFHLAVLLIIAAAVVRSAIATRLDDFTLDEGYHIVAGVSYVQRADFRVNPEHPPLVKLWVGSVVSALGFRLGSLRQFNDKESERTFVNEAVYAQNDPELLQEHARWAMYVLNGMLLVFFAFALRHVFGPVVALATLLCLAIDPTVAAHLPVVMTDLPVSLLAATAVLFATRAFVDWRARDLAACAAALGLALVTKHSALVFGLILAAAGIGLAFVVPRCHPGDTRGRRLGQVMAVFLGASVILWGAYRFRFTESPGAAETFNRPLAAKIADLHSPLKRAALTDIALGHLLPRAYIWGLADTLRGGVEGRFDTRLVFGTPRLEAPFYFFPGVMAVKLPLGLDLLLLAGVFAFIARRLPSSWELPAAFVLVSAALYLVVLAQGASYGGMRHALPAVVLLCVFAGFAAHAAFASQSNWPKAVVAFALGAAAASALPVMRPWEYYNELVGGSEHAYLYFNDEGVDLFQRGKEVARYYHDVLEPAGEIPYLQYIAFDGEAEYQHVDWIGHDMKRDEARFQDPMFTGTIILRAKDLGPRLYGDWAELRRARPIARFGDALVFRGTFNIAPILAEDRYYYGCHALFSEKPDLARAEHLFRQAADLDPSAFYNFIELGNIYLRENLRDRALEAFTAGRDHAPVGTVFRRDLDDQVALLRSGTALPAIPSLRDPAAE